MVAYPNNYLQNKKKMYINFKVEYFDFLFKRDI